MNFLRLIIRFPVGIMLFLFFISAVLVTPVFLSMTSSELYKDTLEKADTYENVNEIAFDTIIKLVEEKLIESFEEEYGQGVEISDELKNTLTPTIENSLNKIVTAEILQATAENNLDKTFEYFFNSNSGEWEIYVPKTYLKDTIKDELPLLVDSLIEEIRNYPECSTEKTEQLVNGTSTGKIVIDCVPGEVKTQFINDEKLEILNDLDEIITKLENSDSVLAGGDEVTLSEFIESVNKEDSPADIRQKVADIDSIREWTSQKNTLVYGVWAGFVLFFLLYASLSKGTIFQKLRNTASALIIESGLILGLLLFTRFILLKTYISGGRIIDILGDSDIVTVRLVDLIVDMCRSLATELLANMILMNFVVFIAFVILMILPMIFKFNIKEDSEQKKKQKNKNGEETPEPSIKDVLEGK